MIYEPLPFLFFIQVNPCLLLTAYCKFLTSPCLETVSGWYKTGSLYQD